MLQSGTCKVLPTRHGRHSACLANNSDCDDPYACCLDPYACDKRAATRDVSAYECNFDNCSQDSIELLFFEPAKPHKA